MILALIRKNSTTFAGFSTLLNQPPLFFVLLCGGWCGGGGGDGGNGVGGGVGGDDRPCGCREEVSGLKIRETLERHEIQLTKNIRPADF